MPSIPMNSRHLDALVLKGVNAEKKFLLRQIDAYDFRHVAVKTSEEYPTLDLEELITEGVPELRRYYAMRIVYGDKYHIGVPVRLDPLAHIHTLFTKEYRKFCAYFFDSFFDHWPCDRSNEEHMAWLGNVYRETLTRMDATFNDRNMKWWPNLKGKNLATFGGKICCGCSCAGQ